MAAAHDQYDAPLSPLGQIDRVAEQFEQKWRQGEPPRIADFVGQAPTELRPQLLVELICVDVEHRSRKRLPVLLSDYFRDFPELDKLAPAERADLETHARKHCRELASTVEFVPLPTKGPADHPASLGPYTIAGQLASGGQADVFLSVHPRLMIPVVVKWLRAPEWLPGVRSERLILEGQVLANLAPHSNLVRVYDLGFEAGRPFLVLEHVQGHSLDQLGLGERLLPCRAAEMVASLAEAVHAAHEQGVIHQDITPGNVILDGRGQPRLIDFGLAWFRPPWTQSAGVERPDAGTPRFLSPEQADPEFGPVDRRTDVFGLGAVLFYLLTEQPLYDGATQLEVLRQAAAGAYNPAALKQQGVPKRLIEVCRKALAHHPQDRFRTAAELAKALRASVRQPSLRLMTGVALLFLVLFLAALGVGWRMGHSGPHGTSAAFSRGEPILAVRVWRPDSNYRTLEEALPVRSGDELQVRFQVPAGLHVGLFSVNGQGRLVLLEQYPPREAAAELVYPAPGKTRSLGPPTGTELLLVCGRSDEPVSEAEVREAWGNSLPWPILASDRLLRVQTGQVKEEGEKPRDFLATQERPEPDPLIHRLDELRERLTTKYPFLEGLAFLHE